MGNTTTLQLPLLEQAQAQKHICVNESLTMLDALVLLSVQSANTLTPPATPADGDRYIVPANATGDWVNRTAHIAAYYNGAWAFFAPRIGWQSYVVDTQRLMLYNGTLWQNDIGHVTGKSLTITSAPNTGSALPNTTPNAWLPLTAGGVGYKIPLWLA